MIAKYLIWVYLCAGHYCQCEKVVLGVNEKKLYLGTEHGEILLTKVRNEGEYIIMRQDTSLYAVMGKKDNGMIIFINHLTKSKRVDKTLIIQFNKQCLPTHDL